MDNRADKHWNPENILIDFGDKTAEKPYKTPVELPDPPAPGLFEKVKKWLTS